MHWTADTKNRSFTLEDGTLDLARIHLSEDPKRKNPFRVKVLISALYAGSVAQRRLERKNKEWKVKTVKFPDEARARRFIDTKKREILAYIRRREEG